MRLTKSELDEILKKNKHVSIYSDIKHPVSNEVIGNDKKFFNVTETEEWKYIGDNQRKLSFTVPGIPVPAPRQTQRDKWMKRPCVMRYREYADRLRSFINLNDMYVGKITMRFFIPMPDSWSFKKKERFDGKPHRVKPDHDNLTKSVQDSLLKNDAMVWSCFTEKFWCFKGSERTELTFETTELYDI